MVDDDDDDGEGSAQDLELDQFDTIIENHEKEKRLRPIFRKRNVSTQTSKSVESSTVSCTTESRSTTATTTASSASSFDLEFISKTKKYISHIPSSSKHQHEQSSETYATTAAAAASAGGEDVELGRKHRSYLPTGSSGLNILNMRFTMGREFESEVSIRIPHQNPHRLHLVFHVLQLPSKPPQHHHSSSSTSSKAYKSSNKFHTTHSQTTSQLPVIGGKSTSHSTERPSRNVLGGAPLKLVPSSRSRIT
ncbi:hypothetical protein Fcan01_28636 [Folsomia candida]|uniref:Uncharacterized protein n=1 Tax=Folsomia candida TaxID=158441 RepID=A0A226CUN8_FOLCA|nr:hypothetical protein Fcan01_28636 [Folsomia candida]